MAHHGIVLRFGGRSHRIDLTELSGGKSVFVYGQQEVVKDLVAARIGTGRPILFEVSDVTVSAFDTDRPVIHFRHAGEDHTLSCDFIAGCDGFHGICRPSIPEYALKIHERLYPFGWFGILAEVAPSSHELVYARHQDGFALLSMRSPNLCRLYLQCAPDEDPKAWPDERIWTELRKRVADDSGFVLEDGPILQKGVTAMRSFIAEPMRHGRLFLLGDAAHIVPPTGAKGMNLAVADVAVLACALDAWYRHADSEDLERYSETCLRRVWKAQRFSWWMTSMLHRFPQHSTFEQNLQLADLDYVTSSRAAATTLAENYVGLAFQSS
jgi:p-hydroxybenzoate 3-monooxygenase